MSRFVNHTFFWDTLQLISTLYITNCVKVSSLQKKNEVEVLKYSLIQTSKIFFFSLDLQKSRIKEASQRYQYALKKFPRDSTPEEAQTFRDLKLNFLLNLSRCKRKMNVIDIFFLFFSFVVNTYTSTFPRFSNGKTKQKRMGFLILHAAYNRYYDEQL